MPFFAVCTKRHTVVAAGEVRLADGGHGWACPEFREGILGERADRMQASEILIASGNFSVSQDHRPVE